ncbi:biotin transporter BioY [uncultured Enorma sp.]|jgi:biotin transport system substrate-specific component|uniref:biotin transporter BioY n=1 Tax=uncultured Enorma sp. TaxID=1714346 RepID=UPI0025E77B81|nr:biotin transporter BioY [uncultured Enorma sp.]
MSSFRIARCGLCIALLAVASYITIPLGPVPFTLQTLVIAMLPVALGGRDAVVTVALYLLLGALGLPVFSGFSGGIAALVGPTGGFLWGFLAGTAFAAGIQRLEAVPEPWREAFGTAGMLLISYAWGTAQLMVVMGMTLPAALALAVAPFVIPDIIKLTAGIQIGRTVRRALRAQRM